MAIALLANLCVNASALSCVLPLAFFLFFAVEWPQPSWGTWNTALHYSLAVIALKFVFQLPIICLQTYPINNPTSRYALPYAQWPVIGNSCVGSYSELMLDPHYVQPMSLLGLRKFGVNGFLLGISWDLVVLLALLLHRHSLWRRGLWKHEDDDTENSPRLCCWRSKVTPLGPPKNITRAVSDGDGSSLSDRVLAFLFPNKIKGANSAFAESAAGLSTAIDGREDVVPRIRAVSSRRIVLFSDESDGLASPAPGIPHSSIREGEIFTADGNHTSSTLSDSVPSGEAAQATQNRSNRPVVTAPEPDSSSLRQTEDVTSAEIRFADDFDVEPEITDPVDAALVSLPWCGRACCPPRSFPDEYFIAPEGFGLRALRYVLPARMYLSLQRAISSPSHVSPPKHGRDLFIYSFSVQVSILLLQRLP